MNMAENRTNRTQPDELAELREEVRRLREEQEKQKEASAGHHDGQQRGGEAEDEDQEKQEPGKLHSPIRKAIAVAVILLVATGVLVWWLSSRHYESTDDAFVDGHISGIAARTAGTIVKVHVEQGQSVRAGQVVVDLDPRDDQVALEQARGQLSQVSAQTSAERPNVPVTEVTNETLIATTKAQVANTEAGLTGAQRDYEAANAKIAESEASNAKAQSDVERYRPLVAKGELAPEQFEQAVTAAKSSAATLLANQKTAASALLQIDQRKAQLEEAQERAREALRNASGQIDIRRQNLKARQAGVEAARAQVDQAELNLSYCRIVTSVDGIVAKRTAEVGQYVTPGQQVFLVTQVNDLWVTANYRETQLRHMRPGQNARIHVDTLGVDFDGYVENMSGATGAAVSLLPPENATGNFVKIVQRLPVRIRLKSGQNGLDRLRPGMSVEPKVRID